MEKKFSKATLMLLFLSILTLAAIITPVTKAENLSVTLNPSEGPAGTTVMVMISGFQAPDPVSITFGKTNVGTIPTYYSDILAQAWYSQFHQYLPARILLPLRIT